MLKIENVKLNYGSFTALNITKPIEISYGDRIGIIGSNGAGKTTLVKTILGLVPHIGRIETELTFENMAVHMQENNYAKNVPIKYIIEAILNTSISKNKKLKELIAFFELEACLNKKYPHLSGGQKQRLTIILVLMQDAKLTFFDEVTSGLDFETRKKLMAKVSDWYKKSGNALCIVSHYYDELDSLTDKLLILEKGNVVAYGKTIDLFQRYCGTSIIIVEQNPQSLALTNHLDRIESPEHLLAFPCSSVEEEIQITALLSKNNINFKRSNCDIEILFVNAVKQFRANI